MLVDDFINIILVDKGVPGLVRVNHDNRAEVAAVQAACRVDTYLARTHQPKRLAAFFHIVAHCLRIVLGTALAAVFALVGAEEYVVFIMGHTLLEIACKICDYARFFWFNKRLTPRSMQKNTSIAGQKFDSITHFIQTGGFDYRVYEMGRKVLPLSKAQFQTIEDQQILYPFPFQQKAWLAFLIWQENKPAEAVIWFLQFPVDELGYLKQEARDAFLIELLEQAGKNILAKQKGKSVLDELNESSFAFKPQEDRLAMLHALAGKELGLGPSHYYQATRDYLSGKSGFDQWQFLGLQGIADVVARLDDDGNRNLLANAFTSIPAVPKQTFATLLENINLAPGLGEVLLSDLTAQLESPGPDPGLLAALLRGLSLAQPGRLRHKALLQVLSTPFANELEVLAAISGRMWLDLNDMSILGLFMEKLALQNQTAFNALLMDLMRMPAMKEKILQLMRNEGQADMLVARFNELIKVLGINNKE